MNTHDSQPSFEAAPGTATEASRALSFGRVAKFMFLDLPEATLRMTLLGAGAAVAGFVGLEAGAFINHGIRESSPGFIAFGIIELCLLATAIKKLFFNEQRSA